MKKREVLEILYAFVYVCLGKSPVTEVEIAIADWVDQDENLLRIKHVFTYLSDFFAKFCFSFHSPDRSGFYITTSTISQVEISERSRRGILENPESAHLFIPQISHGKSAIPGKAIRWIYDRRKNWVWLVGAVIGKEMNQRQRNAVYSMKRNNGSQEMEVICSEVQAIEGSAKRPTPASISDSICDLRKVLPSGISIENETGWFKIKMRGEFLLIDDHP